MIKIEQSVPEVYTRQSRDFQFYGRTFDVVLNSLKTNSELVGDNTVSDNFNTQLIDLLTLTLGFKSRHKYNLNQLVAVCSAFAQIVRNKGSKRSIELAVNALLRAEGIKEEALVDIDSSTSTLRIYIPLALEDTNLLNDLFDYILPAGMSHEIIKQLALTSKSTTTVALTGENPSFKAKKLASETSQVSNKDDGSGIYPSNAHSGLIDNTTVVGGKLPDVEGD